VALNALIFLYRQHLHIELGELGFTLASKQRRLPTVLSKTEVRDVLEHLHGTAKLVIEILYGSGLRINECLKVN
jgi:site-specific recombinase XerD